MSAVGHFLGHFRFHRFRSSFRDRAAECTDSPAEVAEMALAHTVAGTVGAACRRGDLFREAAAACQDVGKVLDRCCLKVNRTEGPNILLYKPAIKYMYKEN